MHRDTEHQPEGEGEGETMTLSADTLNRFWSKVDKLTHPNGCWIWTGAYNTPKRLWKGARTRRPSFRLTSDCTVYAHRLALCLADATNLWDHQHEEACHDPTCANPQCVNPYHQRWGSRADNVRDRYQAN